MATTTKKLAKKVIRIDEEIDQLILSKMRVQETYNEALRRVLGLEEHERREDSRRDRRRAS